MRSPSYTCSRDMAKGLTKEEMKIRKYLIGEWQEDQEQRLDNGLPMENFYEYLEREIMLHEALEMYEVCQTLKRIQDHE